MYISDGIYEKQLEKNVQLSIKEFMDDNNIKYKVIISKNMNMTVIQIQHQNISLKLKIIYYYIDKC
jgi:hypothetical protein